MAGNVHRNIEALEYPVVLLCNPNYKEIVKARYVDKQSNHMFLRIDSVRPQERIANLDAIPFGDYAAVVISDYDKGFVTREDIYRIGQLHPLVFLDTKKVLGDWAKTMTFIKINRKEYRQSSEAIDQDLENKIICTLGADGCRYRQVIYRVNEVEIKNLSGAGDSFLAGLVVKYLETGGDIGTSLVHANNVATIVVQKRGVSTVKG
jgi:D-beta-D-heptose 7-phosphate kinase/D-beta-D-heptose 1-phosphate adenosyltransferase